MPRIRIRRWLPVLLTAVIAVMCAGAAADAEMLPGDHRGLESFEQSVADAIDRESIVLNQIRADLDAARGQQESWQTTLSAYRFQHATLKGLLYTPQVPKAEFDSSREQLQASRTRIASRLEELNAVLKTESDQLNRTAEQIQAFERQKSDLLNTGHPAPLKKEIDRLLKMLGQKKDLLSAVIAIRQQRLEALREIRDAFDEIEAPFNERLKEITQSRLFTRRNALNPIAAIGGAVTETAGMFKRLKEMTASAALSAYLQFMWQSAGVAVIAFLLVFASAVFFLLRLRQVLNRILVRPAVQSQPILVLIFEMLRDYVVLGGLALFAHGCTGISEVVVLAPVVVPVRDLLLLWLFTGWFKALFRFCRRYQFLPNTLPLIMGPVFLLLATIRAYGTVHVAISWVAPAADQVQYLIRIAFELYLAIWCVIMGRKIRSGRFVLPVPGREDGADLRPAIAGILFLIGFSGIVLELAGFGLMAHHVLSSVGRTAVTVMWAALLLGGMIRLDAVREQAASADSEGGGISDPVDWALIRLGMLLWLALFPVALIFAWGGGQQFLFTLIGAMDRPLQIGNLRISFLGTLYAVMTLLATHAVARIWQHLFHARLQRNRKMEIGLQESLTTLSVYIIWSLGILLALHVFGMNTATLAVAFGALGIGLGFGLQNIFNNFISGIILLFERPIQVGDDVEVGGIWATVKKINVRATIVQTYDNASLIIPNSEFISQQVTNWSFKDKRVRRKINVGVAYGSDIEAVRRVLLDIAAQTPAVLKRPAPDVLFTDFGDSALIFQLRVWTDVDNMLRVETDIRFAIDSRFREQGIEIAFPQRDLHIRSATGLTAIPVPQGDETPDPS